jgi:predicted ATPase/DNA-binding SARP family transcriptional activator
MVSNLADSLKFSFYGPADPKVQILNYLKEKRMLLLLDNLEHLLNGAGLVSEILTTASGVRCLTTSRELLKLKEEWAFQLKGLEYPKDEKSVESVEDYSAVKLFLQGAKRSDTSFRLSQEDKPFVVQVCQGVEGMPLGIELASSWVRALSLKEIAKEVSKSLGFFATGQRDLAERHRSLKAVFEHSYSLLTQEEQRAFRRMSVFRGGFSREAAEKVAGATLPVIASLIDKSFIRKTPSGRYEVHELMRQFGEEKLKGVSGEKKRIRDLHSHYFAEFLQQREEPIRAYKQCETIREIRQEIDNIRTALDWSAERGHLKDLDMACFTLAASYCTHGFSTLEAILRGLLRKLEKGKRRSRAYWKLAMLYGRQRYLQGNCEEGKEIQRKCLAFFRKTRALKETAYCIQGLGVVHYLQNEYGEAKQLLLESIRIANTFSIPDGTLRFVKTDSLLDLGGIFHKEGNNNEAVRCIEESIRIAHDGGNQAQVAAGLVCRGDLLNQSPVGLLKAKDIFLQCRAICRELGESYILRLSSSGLGTVYRMLGEYDEAKSLFQECFTIAKEFGDERGKVESLVGLGLISEAQGENQEAEGLFQKSLDVSRAIDYPIGVEEAQCCLGKIALRQGKLKEARRLFQGSLSLAKEIKDSCGMVECYIGLGQVACGLGEYEESEKAFRQVLQGAMRLGAVFKALSALLGLALLLSKQGEKERALELVGLVQNSAGRHKGIQDWAKALLKEMESELPPKAFAVALKRGKGKTLEDVAEEILGEKVTPAGEEKLRVLLLGVPKVCFGDREISDKAWGRRKAKKLFCYLALNQGKTFPCEVLVEAFWPKLSAKQGLVSLYTTLSSIRKILKAETGVEGPVVKLEEGQCGLDPKCEVALDVEEFESLLRKGKHGKEEDQRKATRKALTLARGTFCEGWYDPWVVEEERKLCEDRLFALRRFGSSCLDVGQEEESIGWLEKAVDLDNYHEETFRNLMVAYARTGRKKVLKEAFENLKQVLRKELRAEPERETVELYKKLMATENCGKNEAL